MSVYTVQAPPNSLGEPELENAVLLREGFSWGAFFFGVFWLLWNRLWLAAIVWLFVSAALDWVARSYMGLAQTFLIMFVLRLLLGLEANALLRHRLVQRRYRLIDVVVAEAREVAERIFFGRAAQAQGSAAAVIRSAPPPPVPLRDSGVLGSLPRPQERG